MKKVFTVIVLTFLCIFGAQAASASPPCFATYESLRAGQGDPGFPRFFVSPSGSGFAMYWACKSASGWSGYEIHATQSFALTPNGQYQAVHGTLRWLTQNDWFWTYLAMLGPSCADVATTPTPDAQLNKLCSEVNPALTAFVSSLPK